MTSPAELDTGAAPGAAHGPDPRPPGDRYFRHPGDVVRLVLWALAALAMALFIRLATATSLGLSSDLAAAATSVPRTIRLLILSFVQVAAIVVPAGIVVSLLVVQRWRRTLVVLLGALAGAGTFLLLDVALDLPGRTLGALEGGTWFATTRFPSVVYLSAAAATATVGKPWLGRRWRRATDIALVVLAITMALAGTAGVPALLLAVATGCAAGSAVLVVVGAPNRRPSPAAVSEALGQAGIDAADLSLVRAEGGRAQLYRVPAHDGGAGAFVKVYAQDSRDADLLYRGFRTLVLRGPNDGRPWASLEHGVEHEALLLVLAARAGVSVPELRALTALSDDSMVLAMDDVPGQVLDTVAPEEIDAGLLEAVWREVAVLHRARLAHRALRAGNILVADGRPVLVDLSFGVESASPRLQAIDRAELLASTAALVGSERAVAAAARVLTPADLVAAVPYIQPLALSAATRKRVSKGVLRDLRAGIETTTGEEAPPLEKLVRVRPRTVVTVVALSAAFYVLLPQLADVGDSFDAIRNANWFWLVVAVLMSLLTYVASAIGMAGGVPQRLPFVPNVAAQLASSFVNRVTPANVGGMALNVRFLQKAGVAPAEAVTGMGLNVVAGGIVHLGLLVVFLAAAGKGDTSAFKIPSSSKLLVAIAVVLAVAGIVAATRRGRRLIQTHVFRAMKQSWSSIVTLARSPLKLAALFGGSVGVTMAYVTALAAAVRAFDGDVSFAQVGAVYLGASIIAAAAPTPGGLGAMEAALVAGFTGTGMEGGVAVAAVLSYRLATYWLPILPGWISFQLLERRNII